MNKVWHILYHVFIRPIKVLRILAYGTKYQQGSLVEYKPFPNLRPNITDTGLLLKTWSYDPVSYLVVSLKNTRYTQLPEIVKEVSARETLEFLNSGEFLVLETDIIRHLFGSVESLDVNYLLTHRRECVREFAKQYFKV